MPFADNPSMLSLVCYPFSCLNLPHQSWIFAELLFNYAAANRLSELLFTLGSLKTIAAILFLIGKAQGE